MSNYREVLDSIVNHISWDEEDDEGRIAEKLCALYNLDRESISYLSNRAGAELVNMNRCPRCGEFLEARVYKEYHGGEYGYEEMTELCCPHGCQDSNMY